jgi:dipeptidyl aminopeptidase/acylaminoacyl peptidase
VAPSPDGQWLAYYSIGNQMDLLISRSDGSGERELTHDPANDRYPSWSPDGRHIAIMSNRSGKNQIWSIKPDGSDLRQLTFAPDGVMSDAKWSPEGSRIVYVGGASADDERMFVFEPAKPWTAQTPQQFSRVVEPGVLFTPSGAWSPDGTRLLGDALPGGLLTYSFASGRFTRLTDIGDAWTWLTDSRRALFTHRGKLFIVDTISKATRALLSVAPDDFDSVALSHDNRALYFTREIQRGDIWLMTFK